MSTNLSLLQLPAELLPVITSHLSYPDVLSLRLAHPHFYHSPLLDTDNDAGIRSRVAWLCSVYTSGLVPVLGKAANNSSASSRWTTFALVFPRWLYSYPHQLGGLGGYAKKGDSVIVRTDTEFRRSEHIQHILRLRLGHACCSNKAGEECRVVPGTHCNGPKQMKRRQSPFTTSLTDALRGLVSQARALQKGMILESWDVLFLFLAAVLICGPWILCIQEISRWFGHEVSSHIAGLVVLGLGSMLAKSMLTQQRPLPVKLTQNGVWQVVL